jgi:hypothetical protein
MMSTNEKKILIVSEKKNNGNKDSKASNEF